MKGSDNTQLRLESALTRLLEGTPVHIQADRKLSVRAVEEEARLGNGSAYYYPELITRIKVAILQGQKYGPATPSPVPTLRARLNKTQKLKLALREENRALKLTVSNMAAEHHRLAWALREVHLRIEELEVALTEAKRAGIHRLK